MKPLANAHTTFPLELTEADDRYYDYCLWEYAPVANPQGKLRSINLLNNTFASEAIGPHAAEVIAAIRQAFGMARTVWGVKQENGKISWELYFYDYDRQHRARSITQLLQVIKPWIACDLTVRESSDYFMFSIDLNYALLNEGAQMDELQMYMGNVGSTVSSGICYAVTKDAMTMKNFYFFFDARTQAREIVDKVRSSVYLDLAHFDLDTVLWPELRECQTIVVANKRTHDGVYFSRITIDQLLFFLRKMQFPTEQIAFAEQHRAGLDHLLYDVGIDYRMENGVVKVLKSAYYGVF
ncbi:hypothetical protein [Herminiimonas aquatilis]|uniref:Uncharacterized protein n=1 Tax=Herminiimonas aquatilis TaxID=345342 RepID=A0ABW2J1Q9_9BURK